MGFLRKSLFLRALRNSLTQAQSSLLLDYKRIKWYFTRRYKIRNYLKLHSVRKLQLGSGQNILPEWLNTDLFPSSKDVVYLNVVEQFPVEDNTFEYIFCEHMIEHLSFSDAKFMLCECLRTLKPGGRIRISCPCLDNFVGLYGSKQEVQKMYIDWVRARYFKDASEAQVSFAINSIFYNFGHKFMYDRITLQKVLENIGFRGVIFSKPKISEDPNLKDIDGHDFIIGEAFNRFESLILEAAKPC